MCDLTLLIRVGGVSAALLWGCVGHWLWGTGTRAHFNLGPDATAASAAVCIMNKTSLWPLSGVYWTVQPCLPLCPSLSLPLSLSLMCAQPPLPIPPLFSACVYATDPLLMTKVDVKKAFSCAASVLSVLVNESITVADVWFWIWICRILPEIR